LVAQHERQADEQTSVPWSCLEALAIALLGFFDAIGVAEKIAKKV
jgi:hypothetical protein